MKKFEYKTEEMLGRDPDREEKYLNEEGANGWELVSVLEYSKGQNNIYYWKREIPKPTQPNW